MIKRISIAALMLMALISSSCKKNLDDNPSTKLATINTVTEAQTLLDNMKYINNGRPFLAELGSDDYFAPTDEWKNFDQVSKYGYIWDTDPYKGEQVFDWSFCYNSIYSSNIVLDNSKKLEKKNDLPDVEFVRGQAFFHRGLNYWLLAQLFCNPYDSNTAKDSLGLPLRLQANVEELVPRASIQKTYEQIIQDLTMALTRLPASNQYPTRPSSAAAAAQLARVYLSMGITDSALKYADLSLSQYNKLMNFAAIPDISAPFKQYNEETIFFATMGGSAVFNVGNHCPVDTLLYASYDTNDLRKELFFTNGNNNYKIFKGSYSGATSKFCGITTSEMYLTRAECYARKDKIREALNDLNTLLKNRWKDNNTFKPYTSMPQNNLLSLIWKERRKELLFRGLRWVDIRRLNVRDTSINLTRNIDGKTITLPARSPNFTYPIPEQEIEKNPMKQNTRQ